LLGNGDGTFKPNVDFTTGQTPHAVATVDLNHDGNLDLVVGNYSSSTVSILLGNGDGSFQPSIDFAAATNPHWVALADFNGDGNPDIVVANYGSGTVSVLLGNGDGTFQPHVDYLTGTNPPGVATEDFNGDGRLDLVVPNQGSNTVSVLMGNGDGTFQPKTDYASDTGPSALATGDFNGDGRLDFVVANFYGNSVSVFRQAPGVAVSSANLTFGVQSVGTSSAGQTVTLTSNGSFPLHVSAIAISGANFGDFSETDGCTVSSPLAVGNTCTIIVTFSPSGVGTRTATVSITDDAGDSPQSITLTGTGTLAATSLSITAPTISYGSAASVTVTLSSGQGTVTGSVSLTVDNGTPLTQPLSGGSSIFSVNSLAVGSHNLSASYSAQGNFGASSSTATLQVNQAQPTISIGNIPSGAVYGGNFAPTYTYAGDGTTSVTSGTATTCTVSSGVVNFVGTGTCTLTAHSSATTNYAAANGSAQSFTIVQATATISINNIPNNAVFGGSFTPTFAYTGDGTTSVTSSTTTCTVSSGLVRFAGAGTCTLIAHATAGTNYLAATGNPQSFSVAQAVATISVNNIPAGAKFGGSFTPTYSYIGDGTPSVTSSTTATCTVAGGLVNFVGAGTCTLTARATAGVNYAAATGNPQSFLIGQATPTISINNVPSNAKFGGSFAPAYAYMGDGTTSVTSSTTTTCTVSGIVVNFVGLGPCTLTAHATATVNSAATTGSPQSFTITQATPTISINNIPVSAVFGGSFTLTYAYVGNGTRSTTSSTPSTCTVVMKVNVKFLGAGTCTLTAHATATTNYAAATGNPQSFTIAQATTTISIKNIPTNTKKGGSFTPAYNYTGDGTPSTTSSTLNICTVSGNIVNFVASGTCTLTPQATAGTNYAAVTGSPQSFTIK
jgi:hypothetical protein